MSEDCHKRIVIAALEDAIEHVKYQFTPDGVRGDDWREYRRRLREALERERRD